MRILVLGSTGLLGSYLYKYGKMQGHEMVGLSRSESPHSDIMGDATDAQWLGRQLKEAQCDLVVNALKFKGSTDECESKKEECWAANFMVPESIAKMRPSFGFVQISTDWVFDGSKKQGYTESDVPYPRNFYGFSKYAAELAVKGCPRHMILRTSGLFGYERPARNFMARALEALRGGRKFQAATDQISQPISALALSKAIFELIKRGAWNETVHAMGAEHISRHELALAIAGHYGLDRSLVVPVTSKARPIFVPNDVPIDISRMESLLGRKGERISGMLKELDSFDGQSRDAGGEKGAET
jgi:dTDP-4-dehydrorhamnose reductase